VIVSYVSTYGSGGGYSRMTIHIRILDYRNLGPTAPTGTPWGNITVAGLNWYVSATDMEDYHKLPLDSSVVCDVYLWFGEGVDYRRETTAPIETIAPYFKLGVSLNLINPWPQGQPS
jgi:hypothetical protein